MGIIEIYRHKEDGYYPFLIREGWQVAQLNYMPEQDLYRINRMERHLLTDEVFVLTKGVAILIGVTGNEGQVIFECVKMQSGSVYNIPMGQWHNIAISKGTELIIVENNNTHLTDVEYKEISEGERHILNDQILKLIQPS